MGILTAKRHRRIEERQDALKHAAAHQAAGLKKVVTETHQFLLFAMINKADVGEFSDGDIEVMRAEYAKVKPDIGQVLQVLSDMEALIAASDQDLPALIEEHKAKLGFAYEAYAQQFEA